MLSLINVVLDVLKVKAVIDIVLDLVLNVGLEVVLKDFFQDVLQNVPKVFLNPIKFEGPTLCVCLLLLNACYDRSKTF